MHFQEWGHVVLDLVWGGQFTPVEDSAVLKQREKYAMRDRACYRWNTVLWLFWEVRKRREEYDGIAYIHGLGKALWERTPWLRTGDDSHTAGSEADRELLCGLGVKFVESYELVPYLYRMEKYSNNNTTRQPDFLPCSALDRFHSRRLCLLEIYFIFCPLKVMTLIFAFGKVFGFHKT